MRVALSCAIGAHREAVQQRAWERSYELAADCEPMFADAVIDPKTGCRKIVPREPVRYPEFDGNTRVEWVQAQLQSVADCGEISVFEEWTLHRDYSCGIGLHATIDVRHLTVDAVNGFIDRFLAIEADYRDPVPRSWRYEQVPYWGIESNALVEPWDWAEAEARAGQPAPAR